MGFNRRKMDAERNAKADAEAATRRAAERLRSSRMRNA
jgi:hypothetical protein